MLGTIISGSKAQGVDMPGSDTDYVTIYVASLEQTLGINGCPKTRQDGDHTYYELRHFLSLAAKGNPNLFVPLFVDEQFIVESTPAFMELRSMADSFVSKSAIRQHIGYMVDQRRHFVEHKRMPNRKELVDQHGYDTKFAAHAVRLGRQGIELGTTGRIAMPMNQDDIDIIRAIRSGVYTEQMIVQHIDYLLDELRRAEQTNDLPDGPDYASINAYAIRTQMEQYANRS